MTSRKVFVSCRPGDEKHATVQGQPLRAIKGVKVLTSQDLYTPEDLEAADTYFLIITPSYLETPWTNFEMGVSVARSKKQRARLVAVLISVEHRQLPTSLRDVLQEQSRSDDGLFLNWPATDGVDTKRR